MEMAKKIFEVFWHEEGKLFMASWARWEAQRKGLVDLENRCQDIRAKEIFQRAIEGKLRVQDRTSERLQDQIIEEIKELESTKTEDLQIARKEHNLWMYQNEKEEAKRLQGVNWAPPRNLTKWPDWEESRKLENCEWRLEPEGEAEVPEIIIVSDAVEGTPVDLDGETRHEQVEAKLSRRGREMLNEDEEIRSPKKKVIRVESGRTFVLSAVAGGGRWFLLPKADPLILNGSRTTGQLGRC